MSANEVLPGDAEATALAEAERWMRHERDDHGRDYGFEETLLAEYDRRGAELERLRARVAELENGPLIYGVRVPDGRVLALSESPGHVGEGYTQMQARRGPWEPVVLADDLPGCGWVEPS